MKLRAVSLGFVVSITLLAACGTPARRGGSPGDMSVPDAGMSVDETPAVCGDKICAPSEDCRDCAIDCGECPTCPLAPSCSGAVGVPAGSEYLESCNNEGASSHECGATESYAEDESCFAPELKLRVRRLVVEDDGGFLGAGSVSLFCAINASDGEKSTLTLIPLQENLNSGESVVFDPSLGTFWGQEGLEPAQRNLAITFECFEANSEAFKQIVDSVGEGAEGLSQIPEVANSEYGWAFGVGGVVADVLGQALDGPETSRRMNVELRLASRAFYDLTNGRYFRIDAEDAGRRFYLEVEAWGCAISR